MACTSPTTSLITTTTINNKSNILITDTVYSTLKEDEEAGF